MTRHPKRSLIRPTRTRQPRHPVPDAEMLDALTWPESMRVEARMSRPPAVLRWDALVDEAARLMRTRQIRHIPVLDQEDRLVGIVTDRDLRQVVFDPAVQERLGRAPGALRDLRVRDVMTWAPVTVRPEAPLRDAARLMHQKKIGALPVVVGERLAGILTETDVLRAFEEVVGEGVLSKPFRWALRAP